MADNSAPQRRGPGRPFQKGQSGNPGGRPKGVAEVIELARSKSVKAIETLAHLCESAESEQARIAAATALLDRAWGRPSQRMEHAGDQGAPIRFKLIIGDGGDE